jgi:hypothetical protein
MLKSCYLIDLEFRNVTSSLHTHPSFTPPLDNSFDLLPRYILCTRGLVLGISEQQNCGFHCDFSDLTYLSSHENLVTHANFEHDRYTRSVNLSKPPMISLLVSQLQTVISHRENCGTVGQNSARASANITIRRSQTLDSSQRRSMYTAYIMPWVPP